MLRAVVMEAALPVIFPDPKSVGKSAAVNFLNPGAALLPLVGPTKTKLAEVVAVPIPPLATGNTPETPLVKGRSVAFVNVTALGVPKFGETKVLFDKVSVPAKVAKVPIRGSVTFVVFVAFNVVSKAPVVTKLPPNLMVLSVLSQPVPPFLPNTIPDTFKAFPPEIALAT